MSFFLHDFDQNGSEWIKLDQIRLIGSISIKLDQIRQKRSVESYRIKLEKFVTSLIELDQGKSNWVKLDQLGSI